MESNRKEPKMLYKTETIAECFPQKSEDWHRKTTDDLNSVHSHVDALVESGMTGEEAWLETIQQMSAQRLAERAGR